MDITFTVLVLLFSIALVAGLIDAIAGGGSFSASLYFIHQQAVSFRKIWLLILITLPTQKCLISRQI